MDIKEVEKYVNVIIPNIEKRLVDDSLSAKEKLELYSLYVDTMRIVAPHDFITFNKYLELDDDHSNPNRAFYHHRKKHLGELFKALNDMEVYDAYDMLLVSTPPRVGKALRNSEKVLTTKGWKEISDIRVGEKVFGANGKPTKVIGVYPQGKRDIYRVTFDDDTTVDCDLEHLWTVQTREDRLRGKKRTITTKEMIGNLYVEGDKRKNYSIEYVKPIQFRNKLKNDDLHPYLLGALIGDGGFGERSIKFSGVDEELNNRVTELLPQTDVMKKLSKDINRCDFYICKKDTTIRNKMGYPTKCTTAQKLFDYGLYGKKSEDKFIPKQYLYSTITNRVELLRGLMDTDGYSGSNGNSYNEFTTVSEQLAEDFVELVRSLGARATINTKVGSYKKNGVMVHCQKVYRITFNMEINPFYITRKSSNFMPRKTRNNKYIVSIEQVGVDNATCILVEDKEHLFVTNGYNLTHNTTAGIRFLSWIIGRHPIETQLATSYSDAITASFYAGVSEVTMGDRFKDVFPNSPLVNQNAKRQEIWLSEIKRYPSISFVSIGGSMTGRAEASNYLYVDDIISGLEEAMSKPRLEKLWQLYTVNAKQRKKDKAKEIHIATQWSLFDPITKLAIENEDNPRCKIIKIPCYDENGESQFDFVGGFSTEYYKELERSMDSISFGALYMCNPIEREGLLYHKEDLQYYFELPNEKPDTIISIVDSKNLGKDYVSSPIGYVYGDFVYIDDVVYNNGLPEVTRELVANKWVQHGVVRGDVEMNNGGNYYAEDLDNLVRQKGGKTSIRMFFTGNNKDTKIITYSDYVKKYFIFKDPSKYPANGEYAKFMEHIFAWTQMGKNKYDDAPDSVAMLAQLVQELQGSAIKILSRRELGI